MLVYQSLLVYEVRETLCGVVDEGLLWVALRLTLFRLKIDQSKHEWAF